jgi:ribonuclease HII
VTAPLRIGVDENGLGPRLGPLVVTAVVARVDEPGRALVGRAPRGALAKRLGDSKAMVAHRDVELGEAWARALIARAGRSASTTDELVRALALESADDLRGACPSHVEAQCWGTEGEPLEADARTLKAVAGDLDRLAAKGVHVLGVRASVVCTQRLNAARAAGLSRFDVDLHAMERLVLALSAELGGPIEAVCGKVGGYARYSRAFGPLAGRLHAVVEEGAARSAYRFPGLGELAFVRDADANDLLVAMASMAGKWLREALMARIVRFYDAPDAEPRRASGYHDPVTERFVEATALLRRKLAVPDACFERAPDARAPAR